MITSFSLWLLIQLLHISFVLNALSLFQHFRLALEPCPSFSPLQIPPCVFRSAFYAVILGEYATTTFTCFSNCLSRRLFAFLMTWSSRPTLPPGSTPGSVGLPSSSVPLVASSLPLVPTFLAPIEFRSIANFLEPETATFRMYSATLDVQPLPYPSVETSARVVTVHDLPPSPDLHDQE